MKLIEIMGMVHYIHRKQRELYKLEEELHEELGIEPGNWLSDVIYNTDDVKPTDVKKALEREGVTKFD